MVAIDRDIEICVLAGGRSDRFSGHNKALQFFDGKPFIMHVIERCRSLDLPIKVFTHDNTQKMSLQKVLPPDIIVYRDQIEGAGRTPLYGMLTAANTVSTKWIFVVSCDAIRLQPSVLRYMISRLLDNTDAIVPRWSNDWIEPLLAIYSVKKMKKWVPFMLTNKPPELKLKLLLDHLDNVEYIEIEDLRVLDPDLSTFVNINSIFDLVPLLEMDDPFARSH
ncbi:MAG: molybdenum cofactor guanylyltransferase [Candidatus Ranarchaeia archaeon]